MILQSKQGVTAFSTFREENIDVKMINKGKEHCCTLQKKKCTCEHRWAPYRVKDIELLIGLLLVSPFIKLH